MKFLVEGEIVKEIGSVKVTFNQVNSVMQGRIIGLGARSDIESRLQLTRHCLLNVVTKLEIDGKEYDPVQVAEKSDLSDKETSKVYATIGACILDGVVLDQESKKKSEGQESPLKRAGTVENAPVQKMEVPEKNVYTPPLLNGNTAG